MATSISFITVNQFKIWHLDRSLKLHILSQSKCSKSLTPLPDRKFGWLELGHQDVIINDSVKIATTTKQ